MEEGWKTINSAPEGVLLQTKREDESGQNLCYMRKWPDGTEEWIEAHSGVTTITHHSFLPPTHWRLA